MEKKTGAIWYSGLATSKWQAGHAKRVVRCPSGSIASPSAVKRDGKKRMACSGPSRMSPIKSGCSANQSDSSGANSCQQCGQVMRERMVRRFWAIDTAVFVSSESETQRKAYSHYARDVNFRNSAIEHFARSAQFPLYISRFLIAKTQWLLAERFWEDATFLKDKEPGPG